MRVVLLLLGWLAAGRCEDQPQGKQLIMLEIERLNYPGEDKVVKRQAQVQYGGAPGQFIVRSSDPGGQQPVPPEYLSLLQSLSPQQGQPRDIQQVFITRNPQESYAEFSRPPLPAPPAPPRLTPEQEEMRRLQETSANKHIREQQERALQQALTTGQFAPGFQPQAYQPALQAYQAQPGVAAYQPQPQVPAYQPQSQQSEYQPQPQPPSYRAQEPEPLSQYDTSSFPLEQQYSQSPSPPQYYQTRSIAPAQAPQKFSYSQVQFGSSDFAREALEPRLVTIQQKLQSQVKSQPEYYSSQEYVQPQQEYSVQTQKQTPTTPQHPQQYLIETTPTRAEPEDEPVVRIPRPRRPPPPPQSLYYKPEPQAPASGILESLAPESYSPPETYQPRQYTLVPQYVQRPQTLPAPDAPSRSAIYVQHSGISKRITTQPSYSPYTSGVPRVPTPQGQRALTSSEIQALSKAGFQISPLTLNSLQEPSEISPSYDDDEDIYRSPKSARQSQYVDESKPPGKYPKRIPKPVPLTETERKLLADQGIRNLYRVESSESKEAPVTYVLAIDNTIRKRESDAEQEKN